MSTSLEEFLAPLSEALGHTTIPEIVEPCPYTAGPKPADSTTYTQDELAEWFIAEAVKIGTQVRTATPDTVGAAVLDLLTTFEETGSVVYANTSKFDAYDVLETLKAAGIELHCWDPTARETSVDIAQNAGVGLTVANAGIAETASVVQYASKNSGRGISLLPVTHIALLPIQNLCPTMAELTEHWEAQVAAGQALPSNITFITGPSNTSDIELVRVEGVHGPVHAGVVLINTSD